MELAHRQKRAKFDQGLGALLRVFADKLDEEGTQEKVRFLDRDSQENGLASRVNLSIGVLCVWG